MKKMRKMITLLLCTIMIVNSVFVINSMDVHAEAPMGKFSMTFAGESLEHAVVKYAVDYPDSEEIEAWENVTWYDYTSGETVAATRVVIIPEEGYVLGGERATVSAVSGENAEQPEEPDNYPPENVADYNLCGEKASWDGLWLLRGWTYTFSNLEMVEFQEEPAKLTVAAYDDTYGKIEYLDTEGVWQPVSAGGISDVPALEIRAVVNDPYALKKDGREDTNGWKIEVTGPEGMPGDDLNRVKNDFINDFYDFNKAGLGPDLSYTLSNVQFVVGRGTFRWSYEEIPGHEDEYVGNGTIKIKKATYDNQELDNFNNEYWKNDSEFTETINGEEKTWGGGEGAFVAGTVVTIELVPDRGYQLTKFTINEQPNSTTALDNNISTFTFTVPSKNFHLGAKFTPMDDKVDSKASGISGGTLRVADGEFTNGTAALTVNNTSVSSAEESSFVSKAQQDGFEVAKYVDLKVENRFYKGNETEFWSTNKSELSSPASISLNLTDITADEFEIIHQKHDGTYEVISATYSNGNVQFNTESFSKFAIVAKGMVKSSGTNDDNTEPEEESEQISAAIEAREIFEENLSIEFVEKDIVYDEALKDIVMPDNTYDLSVYSTTRGFISALNKVISANSSVSSLCIYTEKPFCFSAQLIKAIGAGKKDIVYYFTHKGHLYSVTIPANVSVEKVLEKNGFAGPLYVGKQLGTTKLIK